MHRVYFDTNEFLHWEDGSQGYLLRLGKSRSDLEQMGEALREGAIVTLYMPDELELEASLTFDRERGCWIAMEAGPARYLDGST